MTKIAYEVGTVTPHLVVDDAGKAMEFYRKALGAEEVYRLALPNGKVAHGELKLGATTFWIADVIPEIGIMKGGGAPGVTINLHVKDTDAIYAKAIAAGAKSIAEPADMFWGARYARFVDPFGHQWALSQQKKALTVEEVGKAFGDMMKQ